MLIQKKATTAIKLGDVVAYRLLTGEEIIGRVSSLDTNGKVTGVTYPVVAHFQIQNGQMAMGIAPFMGTITEGEEVVIRSEACIVDAMLANGDVRSHYLARITGIVTPSQGIITP